MEVSSSGLWLDRPLHPSACIAMRCSIRTRAIEDVSASVRLRPVDRPASGIAKPSGCSNPPTRTTSRGPPTPNGSASGGPATPGTGGATPEPLRRPPRDLCLWKEYNPLMIRGLSGLLLRLRYKIPRPHRYKIPRFPIPLSWLDLWRSRRALRYKRTSTPTSIVWHRAAWPSSGMVPGAGPSPMIDHHKVLLRPERLRQVPSRFSWCDQRLFRSDLCSG